MGSKAASGAYQAIISLMPPHDSYVEPFLGSGAVMNAKPRCAFSMGADIDGETLAGHGYAPWANIIRADAFYVLESIDYAALGRCLVYCDPPYPHATRSGKRYRHDFTDSDHIKLLEILKKMEVHVMVSTYENDLYNTKLQGWKKAAFQVMTRGGPRTETVFMNYDSETVISQYVGKGFTDRQRVKRKAERWSRSFSAMPAEERSVILAAILKASSEGEK